MNCNNRHIVHLDLDSFFVSVERLHHSELIGKPIVIGGNSDRAVVACASYEARQFGVRSAMPMKVARYLCPEIQSVSGDYDAYTRYSDMVTEAITERAPLFEKSSVDEFYVDLTGMERFFGCYKWAVDLKQTVRNEIGLPITFGLSVNKTVAKIATNEVKPDGQLEVETGHEKEFIAPLSIAKMPMVGKKTNQLLINMGVRKIATLSEIPVDMMERVFGKNGIILWQRANGIDNTPVVPYSDAKSMSTERTFDKDTTDITKLKTILLSMVERLAFDLRRSRKLTSCVTVKIRYSNFDTHTVQSRLPHTAHDHLLIEKTMSLFEKVYKRRMLLRLVGVKFSHLVPGYDQIDLFDDNDRVIRLYQALDCIKMRYGARAVRRASTVRGRRETVDVRRETANVKREKKKDSSDGRIGVRQKTESENGGTGETVRKRQREKVTK